MSENCEICKDLGEWYCGDEPSPAIVCPWGKVITAIHTLVDNMGITPKGCTLRLQMLSRFMQQEVTERLKMIKLVEKTRERMERSEQTMSKAKTINDLKRESIANIHTSAMREFCSMLGISYPSTSNYYLYGVASHILTNLYKKSADLVGDTPVSVMEMVEMGEKMDSIVHIYYPGDKG